MQRNLLRRQHRRHLPRRAGGRVRHRAAHPQRLHRALDRVPRLALLHDKAPDRAAPLQRGHQRARVQLPHRRAADQQVGARPRRRPQQHHVGRAVGAVAQDQQDDRGPGSVAQPPVHDQGLRRDHGADRAGARWQHQAPRSVSRRQRIPGVERQEISENRPRKRR